MVEGFFSAIVLVCVFALGWVVSATTIKDECDKLNSFYVGKNVYDCKIKKDIRD